MIATPPDRVLEAFGAEGEPHRARAERWDNGVGLRRFHCPFAGT